MGSDRAATVTVVLETGSKRVFASALDWPGWCRAGRDADAALAALAGVSSRYAAAVAPSGVTVPTRMVFEVVEVLPGSATTDFGAPGAIATADHRAVGAADAQRLCSIVVATWAEFDRVVAGAPAELRKGPRGGGRDRDAVAAHVGAADHEYAKKLGVRMPRGTDDERRRAVIEMLSRPGDGAPPVDRGWPPRYAARRIAWHALDHAWEIEDRSDG